MIKRETWLYVIGETLCGGALIASLALLLLILGSGVQVNG